MNRLGSIGSSVMVGRMVGVKVGKGVSVTSGVPVGGVVVGCGELITNMSGVKVAGRPNGVAVGPGVFAGVGVCRKGIEISKPEQPDRRETITIIMINLFISPLLQKSTASTKAGIYAFRLPPSYLRVLAAAWGLRSPIGDVAARMKFTAPNAAASPVRGHW